MIGVQGHERERAEGVPQGLQALPQVRCFDRRHERGRDGVSFLPLRIRMPPELQAALHLEPLPDLCVTLHPYHCTRRGTVFTEGVCKLHTGRQGCWYI